MAGAACNLSDLSLFFFPIISLMSSPSKTVNQSASQFLLMLEKLLVSHSTTSRDELSVQRGSSFVSKPETIIFRILQHLWLQVVFGLLGFERVTRFHVSYVYFSLTCCIGFLGYNTVDNSTTHAGIFCFLATM